MESEKKFRLNAVKLALTYPQCDQPKESLLMFLQEKLKDNLKEWCICQEKHQDGNNHLHAYVEVFQRVNYHTNSCLDFEGYHGNYQSCKSKEKWIEYLMKSDQKPLQSQDFKMWIALSKKHMARENNKEKLMLIEEKGLASCVREGIIPLMMLETYRKNINSLKMLEQKDDREELPTRLETPWNFSLIFDLDMKKCHFWLYSKKSNYGKTTFAQKLCQTYIAQNWNLEEKYQPHVTPNTEIIIFDEYSKKNCLTIGLMNQIMDGTVFISAKGLDAWKLNQKPLVIILSNFSPLEIYCNTPNLPNLLSRIEIINLEDNHNGF